MSTYEGSHGNVYINTMRNSTGPEYYIFIYVSSYVEYN